MVVAIQKPAASVRVGNKRPAAGSGLTAGVGRHPESAALNVARSKASATRRAQAILPGGRFTAAGGNLSKRYASLTAGKLAVLALLQALLLLLLQKLLAPLLLLEQSLLPLLQSLLALLLQGLLLLLLLLSLRALLNRLLRPGGCGTQNRLYGQRPRRQRAQRFLRTCRRRSRQKHA